MDRTLPTYNNPGLGGDLEDLRLFIDFLIQNVGSAPFNPKEVAQRLHMDRFVVQDFFEIVRKNFALLKALEQQREWGSLVGLQKISNPSRPMQNSDSALPVPNRISNKQRSITESLIVVEKEELETLQLIQVITAMQPLSCKLVESRPKFSRLCNQFEMFFSETREGIILSQVAEHVVSEYQAYKKINETPEQISFKQFTFKVKES